MVLAATLRVDCQYGPWRRGGSAWQAQLRWPQRVRRSVIEPGRTMPVRAMAASSAAILVASARWLAATRTASGWAARQRGAGGGAARRSAVGIPPDGAGDIIHTPGGAPAIEEMPPPGGAHRPPTARSLLA